RSLNSRYTVWKPRLDIPTKYVLGNASATRSRPPCGLRTKPTSFESASRSRSARARAAMTDQVEKDANGPGNPAHEAPFTPSLDLSSVPETNDDVVVAEATRW